MGGLTGKTALVTGGSRGIGAQVCRTLAAQGAVVAVHYATGKAEAQAVVAEIVAAGGKAFAVNGDLGRHADILALFEQVDAGLTRLAGGTGLDILVNNAGRGGGGSLTQASEADFDEVFNLNVKGTFFVTQEAAKRLRDDGRVINISSLTGRGAHAARIVYATSKWAVNGLTISLAEEFAPRRITVNGIAPGAVDTDLLKGSRGEAFDRMVIAGTAFKRFGQPKDIADVVAFLASPEAGWITGQTIEVSGGARL